MADETAVPQQEGRSRVRVWRRGGILVLLLAAAGAGVVHALGASTAIVVGIGLAIAVGAGAFLRFLPHIARYAGHWRSLRGPRRNGARSGSRQRGPGRSGRPFGRGRSGGAGRRLGAGGRGGALGRRAKGGTPGGGAFGRRRGRGAGAPGGGGSGRRGLFRRKGKGGAPAGGTRPKERSGSRPKGRAGAPGGSRPRARGGRFNPRNWRRTPPPGRRPGGSRRPGGGRGTSPRSRRTGPQQRRRGGRLNPRNWRQSPKPGSRGRAGGNGRGKPGPNRAQPRKQNMRPVRALGWLARRVSPKARRQRRQAKYPLGVPPVRQRLAAFARQLPGAPARLRKRLRARRQGKYPLGRPPLHRRMAGFLLFWRGRRRQARPPFQYWIHPPAPRPDPDDTRMPRPASTPRPAPQTRFQAPFTPAGGHMPTGTTAGGTTPIAEAGEEAAKTFTSYQPENLTDIGQIFPDTAAFFRGLAGSVSHLATHLGDETPLHPSLVEAIQEAVGVMAGLGDHFEELHGQFRAAHADDLERIEEPRTGETMADYAANQG